MEHRNGKPLSTLSETVDYSRVLHNGVSRDVLESLLGEHDEAKQQEITSLRRQVSELSATLAQQQSDSSGANGARDTHAEILQLRQEFATAVASLRAVLTEGDGDLHEMQLTSLRRQISQLEGVLDSNYQRELRVAEDRESALRSEMAQMRQDLRVALETLYRMPAEAESSSENDDLKNLQNQIAEMEASLVHSSNEQQRLTLERETTLKAELAHMRRDLLVTLEASYQLPTDRLRGLDEQIASWRGQVEELQLVILGMQESQDQAAAQQRAALEHEMRELQQQIQMVLEASVPPSEHEELVAQRVVLAQLAERLDEHVSGSGLHFERLVDIVGDKSSTLEAEFATLRTDLQSSLDALTARMESVPESSSLAALESVHERLVELQSTVTANEARIGSLVVERDQRVAADVAGLKSELAASMEELSTRLEVASHEASQHGLGEIQSRLTELQLSLAVRDERDVALLAEREQSFAASLDAELTTLRADVRAVAETVSAWGSGTADDSTDREALQDTLAALQAEMVQIREEQRALLSDQSQAVHDELAASREMLLEASITLRDARSDAPPLTAEAIGEIIAPRLNELQAHWSDAQTEQYRQLISQVADLQSDLDGVRTSMQAIQPVENDGPSPDPMLLEQMQTVLQAVQTREMASDDSTSIDELNRLRYEIQGLRSDLSAALEAASTTASDGAAGAPDFSLDDLVRVIATQLNAGKAEGDRLSANRDQVLRHELSQIRQEVQSAVQQVRASASNGGASGSGVDLSELQAGVTEIRAGLARIPQSADNELRAEVAQLRQELRSALDAVAAAVTAQPVEGDEVGNPLLERVAELERALEASQQEQRRWLEEHDTALFNQLGALSSSLTSAVSDAQQPRDEAGTDEWQENLTELRSEIAALLQRSEIHEVSDESPVFDLVASLRTEMLQGLESIRTSHTTEVQAGSGSPDVPEDLVALATSLQQSSDNQQQIMESQQQTLQAAITQMREEMRAALSGLTRESIDTFEKRQSQLRMDQLEMERNLAQLRQELVATQADPGNKKKLWR